jgi:lysophospholipase L1-like esterase
MASPTHSRSWRTIAAAVFGAAVLTTNVLVVPSATAQSAHHGRGHARDGYLALGDSVPFGFQPAAVAPDYRDPHNFVGYPEVLARHRGLRLVNASCPGETTASMIDPNAQSNGCENSLGSPFGYRTAFPLHTAYPGSQLDFAVSYLRSHRRTRLVSLTIGANDLFLCQRINPDQCTGTDFAVTVAQVEKNVGTILWTLRHRAHYRQKVALVSYYSTDYRDPVVTGGIGALNAALARAAAANRAVVADGFGAMQKAAAVAGGDTCAAGLLIALPTGGCDVHPTPAGHKVLARALGEVAARGRAEAAHR